MWILAPKASLQSKNNSAVRNSRSLTKRIVRNLEASLFVNFCIDCMIIMSSIPQGAFATAKIRANAQKFNYIIEEEFTRTTVTEHPPAKYNSNFMKSIWGLYNRYSVHNLKKITEDAKGFKYEAHKEGEVSKGPKGTNYGQKSKNSWSNINFESLLC